ncbi:YdeI/OmpD-associated family protein [Nocardia lijiangensis]|uniref:YdeI/OmpD-associated family protein n=1 Tax=Nocardia lijiangensis TaxID=299618 RepID=UPI003D7063F2
MVSMGGGLCLGMLKAIRERLGKRPGDTVVVTVLRDTAERTVEVPEELAAASAAAGARAAFDALPSSRRRQLLGAIESAERPQARGGSMRRSLRPGEMRARAAILSGPRPPFRCEKSGLLECPWEAATFRE